MRHHYALHLLFPTCLLLIILGAPLAMHAQDNLIYDACVGGKLFYIPFPDTVQTPLHDIRDSFTDRFLLHVYSPRKNQIRVENPADGSSAVYEIPANEMVEVDVTSLATVITQNNSPHKGALKVEAESPVILYVFAMTRYGCGAYTPIPVELWGTEYVMPSWEGEVVQDLEFVQKDSTRQLVVQGRRGAPAEGVVIAAYDNTRILISPTDRLEGLEGTSPLVVLMNAGDVFQFQSFVDTAEGVGEQADIGGSTITANKPVGFVSGNTRVSLRKDSLIEILPGVSENAAKDLTLEWVPPVETHGKEFVWSTMQEDLRDAYPSYEDLWVTPHQQLRLAGGEGVPLEGMIIDVEGREEEFRTDQSLYDIHQDSARSWLIRTDVPSSAFASPVGLYAYRGIGTGNDFTVIPWSTSMVELIPREEWTSFAPFRTLQTSRSELYEDFSQYLNVVTDTASAGKIVLRAAGGAETIIEFKRDTIAGSDIVVASMLLDSATSYILEGREGARFSGYVYGSTKGYEQVYFTSSKPTYYAYGSLSYAYPLAPSRCALAQPDSYRINVDGCCCEWGVVISAENENPTGLRFVRLLDNPDSTYNATLSFIDPAAPGDLDAKRIGRVTVKLVATDPTQDARAVLLYRDRTREGEVFTYTIDYVAPVLDVDREKINFGRLEPGVESGEQRLVFVNHSSGPITVASPTLVSGNTGFRITRTEPAAGTGGVNLEQGDSLLLYITARIEKEGEERRDSIMLATGCIREYVDLYATTADTSLSVAAIPVAGYGIVTLSPNPFNQDIQMEFVLAREGETTVEIFDASGRLIRELLRENLGRGEHRITRDTDLPSGLYYVRITSGPWSESRRIWSVR